MLLILTALEANTFQTKSKNVLVTKRFLIFLEYKNMIQQCVDIFVCDLLISCLKIKV